MRSDDATQTFAAEDFRFSVVSSDTHVASLVAALFEDLPRAESAGDAVYRIEPRDEPGFVDIEMPSGRVISRLSLSGALAAAVTIVNRQSMESNDDRLHLHAAAVARLEHSAIVCAASGTGKTTLTAELARTGWTYLTDETVSIHRGGEVIDTFAKPLSVKPSGHVMHRHLQPHVIGPASDRDGTWQIPVGRFGVVSNAPGAPRLLVLLERTDGHDLPIVTEVHRADAAARLVSQTMDSQRFGADTIGTLASLCARCRCIRIDAGSPAATAATIAAEFELALIQPPGAIEPLPAVLPGVPDGVVGVLVDGRVVLQDMMTGRYLSLDDEGTAVWLALASGDSLQAAAAVGTEGFVEVLRQHGFLV